jgi:hypothetical protein
LTLKTILASLRKTGKNNFYEDLPFFFHTIHPRFIPIHPKENRSGQQQAQAFVKNTVI